ncbi:hypothetical protein [Lichenifustis flavocetrariae]|uniref:Pentapeptide MXKDX repeat protein n=1 Tax=Lichenifustis flavocetrariae TaxID=2949735 RepID=A0AA41Z3V4_9HYPH|nr:hypothetical protein [Lichenifustis flavocetrariae]MCW6512577.1 hypothetical protein [Lichenifustis flavocetrariae]
MTSKTVAISALALCIGFAALPGANAAESDAMHHGMMKKHMKKGKMMHHGMMKKDEAAPSEDAAPAQ